MKPLKKYISILKYKIKAFINKESFEDIYNHGRELYKNGDITGAKELFKKAINKPNADKQVFYNLALCYQQEKAWAKAIECYYYFLQDRPKDYDGTYNLSLIYYNQKNYEKAAESFERCLNIKREDTAINFLTKSYLNCDKYEKAIELSEQVFSSEFPLELAVAIAEAFEAKSDIHKHNILLDQAIEMYLKILKKYPTSFDSFMSLSICYSKKGDWNNSVNTAMKALKLNPNSFEANNQIGLVYYCSEDIKNSIKFYEKAFKLRPDNEYKIYSNLAYAYEKNGNIKKAINLFNKMLAEFPECPSKENVSSHLEDLKKV